MDEIRMRDDLGLLKLPEDFEYLRQFSPTTQRLTVIVVTENRGSTMKDVRVFDVGSVAVDYSEGSGEWSRGALTQTQMHARGCDCSICKAAECRP